MSELTSYSPLKIGLLIVSIVFFLFTFHGLFTLEWIGEWNDFQGSASFWILITDVSSAIGLAFRFVGGFLAVTVAIYYFAKKVVSKPRVLKILRVVLVFEAIYWFTFITSGVWGFQPLVSAAGEGGSGPGTELSFTLSFVISTGIPCLVESIALPIALFKLAFELRPSKPTKGAIKWGLIGGTVYIFVFWFNNAGLWIHTVILKGTEYLIYYPENLFSFLFTVFGLLALGLFTAYFAKKSFGTDALEMLKMKSVGVIVIIVGFYFLWNYLTWVFFGRTELWSDWYAWFLGHNLDLWALSLPLIGMPLLFRRSS
jgi:hypothetical protein